jgi:hypothetical protein
MKKQLILTMLILLSATAFCDMSWKIKVENRTGATARELYITPSSSDSWSSNFINGKTIEPYATFQTTVTVRQNDYYYDFKMVDTNNNVYIITEEKISLFKKVTVSKDNFDREATEEFKQSLQTPAEDTADSTTDSTAADTEPATPEAEESASAADTTATVEANDNTAAETLGSSYVDGFKDGFSTGYAEGYAEAMKQLKKLLEQQAKQNQSAPSAAE